MIRPGRVRTWLGVLATAAFCIFVVEQAPHLVHHFFEPDQVQPECPFATASERQPGAPAATVSVATAPLSAVPLPPLPDPELVGATRLPAGARAPPLTA
jgi:hypothetical protein